jgi:hypothetical protein
MANPIFVQVAKDGRVLVEAIEFIDAIVKDLQLIPESAIIRRDQVISSLRAYSDQVEAAGREIKTDMAKEAEEAEED